MGRSRAIVIGLDGLPWATWKKVAGRVPSLRDGSAGPLLSCQPPVTIPAWAVAATGRTPGEIGLYGLRVRDGERPRLSRPEDIQAPPVWDATGARTALVGFPPGYPPGPLRGWRVSCFLTPPDGAWAWPPDLQGELRSVVGDYIPDILYRRDDPRGAVRDARAMAAARSRIAAHIARTRPWDLLWLVEMGPDRLQHALGPEDPEVEEHVLWLLESWVEPLAAEHPDAALLLLSDHGSLPARGTFAVNEWLRAEGFLEAPAGLPPGTPIEGRVDLKWVQAWGWGGYWGKVFLNDPSIREEVADRLESVRGPEGLRLRVHRPGELYPECRGSPPDLFIEPSPGWRIGGTVGHPDPFLAANDTGPDGAVHSPEGFWWLRDPEGRGDPGLQSLYDVRPLLEARLRG